MLERTMYVVNGACGVGASRSGFGKHMSLTERVRGQEKEPRHDLLVQRIAGRRLQGSDADDCLW